ncbi:carbonic anhydrase [Polynucleobacter sp. MWH-Svant-W18]|jgi:carbonic anhydrase|uniref:carbonic anhydrase n=1 Tax=Polynucleobacter sp. MWH-Svant-W18 TaxID=1855909 RepID=UPI001BFD9C21|nr:carbonic anhydrase family protein [Polynucleobacter sp. MWH-Svant-W18]QWD78390.1 carbonic anhydrase family protein [Polynucleobacter sp. MWH-Svant-W18]
MKKRFIALALFASSTVVFAAGGTSWGYEGKVGPDNWGNLSQEFATCKVGQQQAPIDIPTMSATKATAPIKTNYKASAGEIINNGHTIQVALSDAGGANLSGVDYKFLQTHFHAPGEEKVDGKSYPFNAHLVHQSADGKLAVIGVFFKEGAENPVFKEVFAQMPDKEGKVALKGKIDPAGLLPKSLAYYSYAGSLTTPPCSEGVTFYILKTPMEMSKAQLEQFKKLYPMNARPTFPLNGRKITETN